MQNIVFLPASDELRKDLYKLGLDFLLVRIEGTLQFMVITNQIRLAQDLAIKHKIESFYTSDNRRNIVYAERKGNVFTICKLGRLQRTETGKPFLIVTEDNATYNYCITPIL